MLFRDSEPNSARKYSEILKTPQRLVYPTHCVRWAGSNGEIDELKSRRSFASPAF